MTKTWSVTKAEITPEKKHVTIQEVVDGDPGKTYSDSVHKTESSAELRDKLKAQINLDRSVITENEAFKTKVESALENFEDFLNG